MMMPEVSQIILLFAGYLIGLAAIQLWHSPEFRKTKIDKAAQVPAVRPEVRPRAKHPRSGVPRHDDR
jgi:hypothetical protein